MPSLQSLGMTTNGLALHRKLPNLVAAGLTNINLSLDTLDEFKFEFMTRRRGATYPPLLSHIHAHYFKQDTLPFYNHYTKL